MIRTHDSFDLAWNIRLVLKKKSANFDKLFYTEVTVWVWCTVDCIIWHIIGLHYLAY